MHLPLMDFGGQRFGIEHLVEYVEVATALGFDAIAVNDHMVFAVPWLDGPTALAAVVSCSGQAQLLAGGSSRGLGLARPSVTTRASVSPLKSGGPASMSR